jgi:4-hydroxy-2-oxoheptanedioate aldolase
MTHNPTRAKLKAGGIGYGMGVRWSPTVEIATLAASIGYDWLFIDLEHSVLTLEAASQISIAAAAQGLTPLVRVPFGEYTMATRALDCGAWGIVIPHVDTADQAREVVSHLKFAPEGHRSIGPAMPQMGYMPMTKAPKIFNDEMFIMVMAETPEGIANADEIAAVPGVDIILVGSNDFTAAAGCPGDYTNPILIDAYKKVIAACNAQGKIPAVGGVYDDVLLPKYIDMGFRMVLAGNDGVFLTAAAKSRRAALKREKA